MDKKRKESLPVKKCVDCVHEDACKLWTFGRVLSPEKAARCPQFETIRDTTAYPIGKLDVAESDTFPQTVVVKLELGAKSASKAADAMKNIADAIKKAADRCENAEHCISCGDVIPEGRQVCPKCGKGEEHGQRMSD